MAQFLDDCRVKVFVTRHEMSEVHPCVKNLRRYFPNRCVMILSIQRQQKLTDTERWYEVLIRFRWKVYGRSPSTSLSSLLSSIPSSFPSAFPSGLGSMF